MTKHPINILLVEDNPDHRDLILMSLRENRIQNEIFTKVTAEAALEYLQDCALDQDCLLPGLILLDIKLPGMSGIELLQLIKEDPTLQTIPVVMLTTSANDKDIVESYKHGANSYVVKPVDYQQFAKALKELKFYWLIINQLPSSY